MARKNVADAAKAKAAKQKKMVIILGVVLTLALGYAVHTMMSLNKSNAASKPQPAAAGATSTPTPSATPTATPSALPAAPTLSGTGAPTATPTDSSATSSSPLISAVKAPANVGQLQSFSLFESKDPFNAAGPSSTPSSGGGKSSGGSKASGGGSAKPPKTPPAPPTPPPTSAVLSVNGTSESVSTGANFPAANPLFELVSLTNTTAKVAVAGGSYADGSAAVTLKVNKPVTLVNTADGTRYTIELLPQGTVASAAPSGTSTTPATTTPASG